MSTFNRYLIVLIIGIFTVLYYAPLSHSYSYTVDSYIVDFEPNIPIKTHEYHPFNTLSYISTLFVILTFVIFVLLTVPAQD